MKVLVTGAHFTTAVAVIEELQKQKNIEIVYVGRKSTREGDSSASPESQILPEMRIKFIPIMTGRLQRSFTPYTILSLLKIPIGFLQAFWILLSEKPQVILSFGGYVAVPVVIAAWLLSIPIVIHEQTLVTGLANKISSWFASKILVSFDVANSFPKNKVTVTGNPLRQEVLRSSHPGGQYQEFFAEAKQANKPVVFVTGGNQGSHAINLAIEQALDKLTKIAFVIHQTGDSKFKDFERLEKLQNKHYTVAKFIHAEMPYLLKNADLVIGRGGINTLTELAYFGTPALIIPVPYLYQDEQNKNAKYFEELGLVKILPQSKLSPDKLLEEITQLIENLENHRLTARQAKSIVQPNAAKMISLEVLLI